MLAISFCYRALRLDWIRLRNQGTRARQGPMAIWHRTKTSWHAARWRTSPEPEIPHAWTRCRCFEPILKFAHAASHGGSFSRRRPPLLLLRVSVAHMDALRQITAGASRWWSSARYQAVRTDENGSNPSTAHGGGIRRLLLMPPRRLFMIGLSIAIVTFGGFLVSFPLLISSWQSTDAHAALGSRLCFKQWWLTTRGRSGEAAIRGEALRGHNPCRQSAP